jgi:hypothetical protein
MGRSIGREQLRLVERLDPRSGSEDEPRAIGDELKVMPFLEGSSPVGGPDRLRAGLALSFAM